MKHFILLMLYKIYAVDNLLFRKFIKKSVLKIDGGEMWSTWIRKIFKDYHNIDVGYGSYGCFKTTNIPADCQIGKYCSFAPNVYIYNANHPKNYVTTHPILYNPTVGYVNEEKISRTKIRIGNDVWFGQNVIVLPSVNYIGDGAIIGAGTIVTKNVEPYSIVVGVPGKAIGYRFDKEKIKKLAEIEWWNWEFDFILSHMEDFYNLDTFLNIIEKV